MNLKYPPNVRFICDKCAICCGDTEKRVRTILLLNVEAQRISKETQKSIDEFAWKVEGSKPYVYQMRKTGGGKCVFLEANLCTVYQVRPLICRFYPFELKTVGNNHVFTFADECPCIGNGPQVRRSFFERLLKESKRSISEDEDTRNKDF